MRPCKCYYSYQGNSEPKLQYEDTHPFGFNLMQVCHCKVLIPCRYWLPLVLVYQGYITAMEQAGTDHRPLVPIPMQLP